VLDHGIEHRRVERPRMVTHHHTRPMSQMRERRCSAVRDR
jgi:hypothetical protein